MNSVYVIRSIVSCCLLLTSGAALAQTGGSFELKWWTIDGGAGTSTGSVYSVSGTIGQPDAGTMSGGCYQLDGGFWGLYAVVQSSNAPLLRITRFAGNVIVAWPASAGTRWVLQQATALASRADLTVWTDVAASVVVAGMENTVTQLVVPRENRFYRLRCL